MCGRQARGVRGAHRAGNRPATGPLVLSRRRSAQGGYEPLGKLSASREVIHALMTDLRKLIDALLVESGARPRYGAAPAR